MSLLSNGGPSITGTNQSSAVAMTTRIRSRSGAWLRSSREIRPSHAMPNAAAPATNATAVNGRVPSNGRRGSVSRHVFWSRRHCGAVTAMRSAPAKPIAGYGPAIVRRRAETGASAA
jgi:hypothetical protein